MSAPSFGILVGLHEQRCQAEYEAISWREIRRTLSGAIADEQLVLQEQRLGGDCADATWAKQLRKSDEKVDREDDEIAHIANGSYRCW